MAPGAERSSPTARARRALRALVDARAPALAVAAVGCALPAVRAVGLVRDASRMQYNDYWAMLDTLLAPDGSWRWEGVLVAQNQHPVVLPKLLYVLNAELTGGDNRALGAAVVAIVAVQVALVALLAHRTPALGRWSRVGIAVTSSVLLFARHGSWSFVKAMSGTAWLTANLLVVAAVVALQRGSRVLPPILGVAATTSYGTGLAAWPALVVGIVVGEGLPGLRRHWPTLATGAVAVTWYLTWNRAGANPPRPSVGELAERAAGGLGWLPSDGRAAVVVGAVVVAALVAAVGLGWRRGDGVALAPWAALGTFGVVAMVLIALGREDTGAGRYSSLSAWALIGAIGAVLVVLPPARWWSLALLPLLAVVVLGGERETPHLRWSTSRHDVLAVAMHLGLADGSHAHGSRRRFPAVTERVARAGHHPFDGDMGVGCGLLGEVVPVTDRMPEGASGRVHRIEPEPDWLPGGTSFSGSARGRPVGCVVVVDPSGRVVGAGHVVPGRDDIVTFSLVARTGPGTRVVARFAGGDELVELPVRLA